MRICVLVADQSEARFYDVESSGTPLLLTGRLTDPQGRSRDRDLKSDRPGRVFDRAAVPGRRRGATAHHGTGGERGPHKHEALRFAHQVAEKLDEARRQNRYDRFVLMAGPSFLGLLRDALPQPLRASIVAEVAKDLVHQTEPVVRQHLPPEVFQVLAPPAQVS